MNRKKEQFVHLDASMRRAIEAGLNAGETFSSIAGRIGVATSTVSREVERNRRNDGPSRKVDRDKNDCAMLRTCKHKHLCDIKGCGRLCRCCPKPCERYCPDYLPRVCERTAKAPFTCNSCGRYAVCPLERWYYSAETAQKAFSERAHLARSGIDLCDEEVEDLCAKVKAGRELGQSVHHIFATEDMPCSERTFYRYVDEGRIPIIALDLAKKVKYKGRHKKKVKEAHVPGFYKGCEYADFMELDPDERARVTEVDTVIGRKRDRKCILSLHRVDLHFQLYLLLPEKKAECVVRALDHLEMACEGHFEELFGLMLCDRGSEFDSIEAMEGSCLHSGKRTNVYFADPSRPDQKGGCEKNHVELRKILPKGTSFEDLDAMALTEICCHVNSSVRKGCGDVSPMQLAQLVFPKEMMDNLGLELIPPRDVVSAPGILYQQGD